MSDAYQVFSPGETLSAGELQDMGQQGTWTPVLTASSVNPALGSGSGQVGDYVLRQGFVDGEFLIQFGSSGVTAGTGTYLISLPTGLGIDPDWASEMPIGRARLRDASVPTVAYQDIKTSLTFPDKLLIVTSADVLTTSAAPWAWAANDSIRGTFTYKTDFT